MINLKVISFSLYLLLISQLCTAQETIIIAVGVPANSVVYTKAGILISELSKIMKVDISLKYYPPHRSQALLKRGLIHADIFRLTSYQTKIPNAIKITVPIADITFHAYTWLKTDTAINGWDSLLPYSIVTVRGYFWPEVYLKKHKTHKVSSSLAAFKFLKAKRAEVFIENYFTTESLFKSKIFNPEGITRLEPPVAIFQAFTFFSSKYPKLAIRFNEALLQLKENGKLNMIMWF